jgi:hypothetical protein
MAEFLVVLSLCCLALVHRQSLLVAIILVPAVNALAADTAILRSGFEIRYERREQHGRTTRRYLHAEPDSSCVDVANEEIVEIQNSEQIQKDDRTATVTQCQRIHYRQLMTW